MKTAQFGCFCAGIVTAAAQPALVSTSAVAVAGFEGGGERTRYAVAAARLPCPVTWNVQFEPFPEQLSDLVARASSFLDHARQLGGTHTATRFNLDDIQIKRIELSAQQLRAIGKDETAFTNQWFTAVTFYGADPVDLTSAQPVCYKHVVMLLDGTSATEEEDPFPRPKWSVTNLPAAESISNTFTRSRFRSSAQDTEPYGKLSRADFPIARVQWDPFDEAFPLDLRAQAPRAEEYLMSVGDIPQRLTLFEIRLWRYVPVEALKAANKPMTEHLHHWEAVFWFRDERHREYDVHMLLDGTILRRSNASPRG